MMCWPAYREGLLLALLVERRPRAKRRLIYKGEMTNRIL